MSAEKTNIETQSRRHRPALIGIGAAVVFAGILFFVFLTFVTDPDETLLDDGAAAVTTD